MVNHPVSNTYQERQWEQCRFLKEGERKVHANEEVRGSLHRPVVVKIVKSVEEKNKGGYKRGMGVKWHSSFPSLTVNEILSDGCRHVSLDSREKGAACNRMHTTKG